MVPVKSENIDEPKEQKQNDNSSQPEGKKSSAGIITAIGKRKSAAARARLRKGSGIVRINNRLLKLYLPEIARMKIEEPLLLSAPISQGVDIDVDVKGGGCFGQADAARQAIARALVAFSKDSALKKKLLNYDRNLLIYDTRQPETRKPSRSSQGARRTRQLSKR